MDILVAILLLVVIAIAFQSVEAVLFGLVFLIAIVVLIRLLRRV